MAVVGEYLHRRALIVRLFVQTPTTQWLFTNVDTDAEALGAALDCHLRHAQTTSALFCDGVCTPGIDRL